MDFEVIAQRDVECLFPDGRREIVSLRIGRPFPDGKPSPDGNQNWCCHVAAIGIRDNAGPIFGVDSWQALLLAQKWLEFIVQSEVDSGASLHWPPGNSSAFSVADLFSHSWRSDT